MTSEQIDLRAELKLSPAALLLLYIGNLESYQGIDLMLEAFALVAARESSSHLVIIGGRDQHIAYYRDKAHQLGLAGRAHLVGPRPVSLLDRYIFQADVLVSPRTKGNNTPMKIYSYLHAGKVTLATRLPTHTQVLDDMIAYLAEPRTEAFANAMSTLIADAELRERLASAALRVAQERYTFQAFSTKLNEIYDKVSLGLKPLDAVVQVGNL